MAKLSYPERIILRAPIWQRLFFPIFIPLVIFWIVTGDDFQAASGWPMAGAILAILFLLLVEAIMVARLVLDKELSVDTEGVHFTDLGRERKFKWSEINFISSAPNAGMFNYSYFIMLENKQRFAIPQNYGLWGDKLGKFLKTYHKAALEAQGIKKQE